MNQLSSKRCHSSLNDLRLLLFLLLNLILLSDVHSQLSFELQAGHTNKITSLGFSENNEYLFSMEENSSLLSVWHMHTGKKLKSIQLDRENNPTDPADEKFIKDVYQRRSSLTSQQPLYNPFLRSFVLAQTNDTFYVKAKSNIKSVRNHKGKSKRKMLYSHGMLRTYDALIKAGDKLISGDDQGNVTVTDLSGFKLKVFKFSDKAISVLSLSNDRQFLAVGNAGGEVFTLNFLTEHITPYRGLNKRITRLDYSNDGNTLFITKDDEVLTYNFKNNTVNKLYLPNKVNFIKIDSISNNSLIHLKYVAKYLYAGTWDVKGSQFHAREILYIKKGDLNLATYTISLSQLEDTCGRRSFSARGHFLTIMKDSIKDTVIDVGSSGITAIKVNRPYKYISVATNDGRIKHFHLDTKQLLFSSIVINHTNYLHLLSNGYYFASKYVFNSINCVQDYKLIPNHQVDLIYNRPDQVIKYIPQHDLLIAAAIENSYVRRAKNTNMTIPGERSNIQLSVKKMPAEKGQFKIHIEVSSERYPIRQIHLLVNGVAEDLNVDKNKHADLTYSFDLSDGKNEIEIFAQDSINNFSPKITFNETYHSKRKPDLYIICIGSGRFLESRYNLNYAAKDAHDVLTLFSLSKRYNTVHQLEFLNEKVDRSILTSINQLLSSAKKRDNVIIFYAGHGILNKDLDYYLSTHSVDFANPEKNGIPYAALESALKSCKARQKLFLIDACHSGEVDKETANNLVSSAPAIVHDVKFRSASQSTQISQNELSLSLSKELFASGSNNTGISIIGASMGSQLALESNQWNNGVFTYSLIRGIGKSFKKGEADYNKDGRIMLNELQFFVNKTVEELTGGLQKPTTRSENLTSNMQVR